MNLRNNKLFKKKLEQAALQAWNFGTPFAIYTDRTGIFGSIFLTLIRHDLHKIVAVVLSDGSYQIVDDEEIHKCPILLN